MKPITVDGKTILLAFVFLTIAGYIGWTGNELINHSTDGDRSEEFANNISIWQVGGIAETNYRDIDMAVEQQDDSLRVIDWGLGNFSLTYYDAEDGGQREIKVGNLVFIKQAV